MTLLWLKGLVKRRPVRLLGTVSGIALTVALLMSLAAFIVSGSASMTRRAVATVPVDWQVQLTPDTAPKTVLAALQQATPVQTTAQVGYAQTAGLEARTGGTVQTTGPGKVLGLPQDYLAKFPSQVRSLVGSLQGALVAQQTAANLHVTVGDNGKNWTGRTASCSDQSRRRRRTPQRRFDVSSRRRSGRQRPASATGQRGVTPSNAVAYAF